MNAKNFSRNSNSCLYNRKINNQKLMLVELLLVDLSEKLISLLKY